MAGRNRRAKNLSIQDDGAAEAHHADKHRTIRQPKGLAPMRPQRDVFDANLVDDAEGEHPPVFNQENSAAQRGAQDQQPAEKNDFTQVQGVVSAAAGWSTGAPSRSAGRDLRPA